MRILLFISIVLLSQFVSWWLLLPFVLVYSFFFTAYELIILGLLIDAVYGVPGSGVVVPFFFTALFSVLVFVVEACKPLILFYEEKV